ncbi:MAG: hypothetical protein IPM45_09045 [Acidimicrobiales bacterium]|nr:hypothetical protein [Acidimicrobiales bacterium]
MLTVESALAAAATLVALAFAGSLLDRWLARRRRHEGAWTVSLAMFAAASAALWAGASLGWDGPTFRLFFLFGAVLNVPYLALGQLYLMFGPRTGDRWAVAVTLFAAFATGVVVAAPFVGPVPVDGLPHASDLFGAGPRILAAVASGVGGLVVIVGSLTSAVRLARGPVRPGPSGRAPVPRGRLALGNVLIATGTITLSLSGTLNARLGEMTAFSVTLVVGVSILFAGFLLATSAARPATGPTATVPPTRPAREPAAV